MTILTLLQEILGTYKAFANGENYFACPFCHNPKKKFAVNQYNLKWHCWHCNARGGHIIWLLKRLNVSRDILHRFKEVLGDVDLTRYKETDTKVTLYLPPEYKPLWKVEKSYPYLHAITYLKNRGFTAQDILQYRIGYAEKGIYAGRIIIPSYDANNQLNYFTARSFYDNGMKYKNPPVTKNVVIFENMIDWDEPIVLCEGMFDAIALKQNAIPLMGKTLPKKVEHAIVQNKVKKVYVFLDVDAQTEALKLEHHLKQYNIDTRLVLTDGKDASEMGFETSWKSINSANTTSFKEFIKQRLSTA